MTRTARLARPGSTGSSRTRRALHGATLGAAVVALAVGCGGGAQSEESAPADDATVTTDEAPAEETSAAEGATEDDAATDDGAAADGAAGELPGDADLAAEQPPVPVEDAIGTAQETAGTGNLVSVGIDHDDDRGWVWELELEADGTEHDLEIDATTGEVLEHEQDDQDRVEDPVVDPDSPLPVQDAIDLALQQQDGRVSGWDLDSDDGTVRYTIDVETGGDDVEVEVDVESHETRVED